MTVDRGFAIEAPYLENSAINVSLGRRFRPLTMSMMGRRGLIYPAAPLIFDGGLMVGFLPLNPSPSGEGFNGKKPTI
ncbi:hypothetical protein, partial [Sphingobium sp. AM]|uniref:hypothetical protein n=1 Tax=Sphingobium sp. AM TaxID=1176302 RepID=UPI001EDB3BD4